MFWDFFDHTQDLFYTDQEIIDMDCFDNIGIIKTDGNYDAALLKFFEEQIKNMKAELKWDKAQIVKVFFRMIPEFAFKEKGKYLDSKM